MRLLTLIIICGAVLYSCSSNENKKPEVPAKVIDGFKHYAPEVDVSTLTWVMEHEGAWLTNYSDGEHMWEIEFTPEGHFMYRDREVDSLPGHAADSLLAQHPGYTITEVDIMEMEGGFKGYEVFMKLGDSELDILTDEFGRVISVHSNDSATHSDDDNGEDDHDEEDDDEGDHEEADHADDDDA